MEINDIKRILKDKKITYKEISENTGISLGTLNEIFRGKTKNPRLDTLKLICNYLNINTNNLFEDSKIEFQLTEEEKEFLKAFRSLSEPQKKYLKVYINTLLDKEIFINSKRSLK